VNLERNVGVVEAKGIELFEDRRGPRSLVSLDCPLSVASYGWRTWSGGVSPCFADRINQKSHDFSTKARLPTNNGEM
jgi:hypothetical protein